ncbi:hypothetical protein Q8A73_021019 [Channa argus]|nr:hypothetical protein Q8A73_021019 [Channa argus]
MGRQKKWSLAARSPFATIRGHLGPRRRGVEGLCISSLLGVLRSHTWLIGNEEVAWLLARTSSQCYQHHRAHSLSFSLCSSSADGGSEDLGDPRSPSLDPHLSHVGQGSAYMRRISMLGDITTALAVVFAFAVTFPSEWMDCLQSVLSVTTHISVWNWPPKGLVTDDCLIMASFLTVIRSEIVARTVSSTGGSIDSDCAFEGDYAVPPLSMTEGMQHIRIMEGVSRSLPSSPLLTHQTISVRLQPMKKLTAPLPAQLDSSKLVCALASEDRTPPMPEIGEVGGRVLAEGSIREQPAAGVKAVTL